MARRFLSMLLVGVLPTLASADELGRKLINPDFSDDVVVRKDDLAPLCKTAFTIRLSTLHGGKQEGSRLLVLDNGRMAITLVPTRGLGIFAVTLGELRLGWDSPVQSVVHPAYVNLLARGGLGWLEGFNEWLCRCGLENAGQPGKDEFITNTGDKATMDLTLHGKIANIPAAEVDVAVEQAAPYRITVRARVEEKMLFGPKLVLMTEVSTEPGSTSFRVKDTVINKGAQPQEFQMLYHCNFGPPLLQAGSRLRTAVQRVTPFNARAAQDVKSWSEFVGPEAGYVEQVYLLSPLADPKGQAVVLLHDRGLERGASMRYDVKDLPYLTLWKNTGAVADGYVIGVEPGTSYPNNRRVERAAGRVPKLAPKAGHTMTIDFALHEGRGAIERVAEEIELVQRAQPPVLEPAPQPR